MKIEITLDDAQDQEDLYHLLSCDEHRPGFVDRLWHLLHDATTIAVPARVSLTVTGIDSDEAMDLTEFRWGGHADAE